MEEIKTILSSAASIFMFFCIIFAFAKITNENKAVYVLGEIFFSSAIILIEVAVIYIKDMMAETYLGEMLALTICFIYATLNVRNLCILFEKRKKSKSKKGKKFDRRV